MLELTISKAIMNLYIDGNDGTGKSSVITVLKDMLKNIIIHDRSVLTKLTDEIKLPEKLDSKATYIILDAEINTCLKRIAERGQEKDKYETYNALFKYRNRYKRLAVKYNIPFIDTTNMTIVEVAIEITKIINQEASYTIPNPDNYTEEMFEKLDKVAEGESKIVRNINDKYNLIEYKPTVYSHKQQRGGVVPYTDKERMEMTRYILYLLDIECIPHAYIYIGEKYVLCEKLIPDKDIPPIEIIVKKCCVGTDKHRYFNIDKKTDRFGKPVVNKHRSEYPVNVVRFDYRNPNHDPETRQPIGDYLLCDDLADRFIDVANAKELANRTFTALDKHFKKMGIYFEDICFMITTNGKTHYSEISQDCGRYKKEDDDGLSALDKDVWRSGGSSDLVHEKWRQMTVIVKDYVEKNYRNIS